MFDTGLEPVTSVVGGRRLDDWATEAPRLVFCYFQNRSANKVERGQAFSSDGSSHEYVSLSDEEPSLETLHICIPYFGSTATFLYFDLYFYTAYAVH